MTGVQTCALPIYSVSNMPNYSSDSAVAAMVKYGVITDIEVNTIDAGMGFDKNGVILNSKSTITLANGKEIELYAHKDEKLDFNKPVDANGNEVTVNELSSSEIKKSVVGFKTAKNTNENYKKYDILTEKVADIKVVAGKIATTELNADDLFVDGRLTTAGEDFYAFLEKDATPANTTKVEVGGKFYNVTYTEANISDVKKTDEGYEFTVTVNVQDPTNTANTNKDVKLVVKGQEQAKLVKLRNAINNVTSLNNDVALVAGADRFETAVEISKATYQTSGAVAGGVVLVGEEAIVDGLAVAPLAAQKDAPILLTGKDKLNAKTKAEITRLKKNNANFDTIYIAGGTSVISNDVEEELRQFGVTIKRLAGADRAATSLAIAKEMNISENAFVVGADGEADAMSIASYAAQIGAPIVVTPANGLTDAAKVFLKDMTDVDVIGGESKVSTQVLKDIKESVATPQTIERVSGATRHDTNAKVINKYYENVITNVFVAKDGYGAGQDAKLIDALAAAPLAAEKKAPIVLATTEATEAQVKAIKDNKKEALQTLTQIGKGIATKTIDAIADVLTLR